MVHCLVLFLFFFFVLVNTQIINIDAEEVEALTTFYNNFNGNYWVNSLNWNSQGYLCTDNGWVGVSCWIDASDNYHIYILSLTNFNVTGNFGTFTSWGSWPYLQSIFMGQNSISGTIPTSFWTLANLKQLHLTGNQLSGTISSSIQNLINLAELQLDYNSLVGSLPQQIFELPYLSRLLLANNTFTGSLIMTLNGSQSGLTYMDIGQSNLGGTIPSMLYTYTSLQLLVLSGNPALKTPVGMTGPILPAFGNLNQLTNLDLSHNKFTGTIPSELTSLPLINQLSLTENQLQGTIPDNFQNMTQLLQLQLGLNSLSGTIPHSIYQCYNLQLLDLGVNLLNGTISTEILNLQSLQTLNLKGQPPSGAKNTKYPRLTGVIPSQLWKLSNLQFLYISYNQLNGTISDTIGYDMPYLKTVSMESNLLSGSIPTSFYLLNNISFFYAFSNLLSGEITNGFYNTSIKSLDIHGNILQGFVPSFFNFSHNMMNPANTLVGNQFLCPITKYQQKTYGASCSSSSFTSFTTSTKIFNEIDFNTTFLGSYNQWSLQNLSCLLGTTSNGTEGVVLEINTLHTTCMFGPNPILEGYQPLTIYFTNVPILTILGSKSLLLYGRPKIDSIFPSAWREQGGNNEQTISVTGSHFIPTGILTCKFKDYENITVFAASYIDYNNVLCPIPPYLHSPIVYNATVELFISNDADSTHYSNQSLQFTYFPWCYGFPACGGDDKGTCIHNITGERPYCLCRTTGFDNSSYCFNCLRLHYGPDCLPCQDCHNGTCNDGYFGNGVCKCFFFYTGSDCLVFWVNYAAPILAAVILIVIVSLVVTCCKWKRRSAKKKLQSKKVEEKVEDNVYKEFS